MVERFIILIIGFFIFIRCDAQKLQIVPHLGFQYHGISYISESDIHPEDFLKSVPELEAAIGIDIKYKSNRLTHVMSLQNPVLGPSFTYANMFADNGIIPVLAGHKHSSGPNLISFNYTLQKESRRFLKLTAESSIKFYYAAGVGVSFNKTKRYYVTTLFPVHVSIFSEENYSRYTVEHDRSSDIGIFLPIRAGMNFYNRKRKNFLVLNGFWNQGFMKMAEYVIDYDYGYYRYPQYQRSVADVRLKSRGTVFGVTVGVPIRILR